MIKLPEDFAVTQMRRDVRDALQLDGEQCVVFATRHEVSDGGLDADRCPECYDDVYNEGEIECDLCYGTGFENPFKAAATVWAVFSDQVEDEEFGQRGVWEPVVREMQTEAFPRLMQHDFVVRVRRWNRDGTIAEVEGFYSIQKVTPTSVRTGARHGHDDWDVVGQKGTVAKLSSSAPITRYPMLGKKFNRAVVEPVPSLATPAVVMPDTKVVYVPVVPQQCEHVEPDPAAPITPTPPGVEWRQMYFHRQDTPSTTWIIKHPFDYIPSVTLFVNGEEGDTDVEFPDEHTAVLTFATPQKGVAQLI